MKMSRNQALDLAGESVRLGSHLRRRCRVFADGCHAHRAMDFWSAMVAVAIEAGATTINIPDTVGFITPAEYTAIFRMLRELPGAEKIIFSTHCHDDLGLATANTLAGIEGGARQVEVAVNGIGERAGNAALEEVAAALMVRQDVLPYKSNIVHKKLYPTSALLSEILGLQVAPNKAVVGQECVLARERHSSARRCFRIR